MNKSRLAVLAMLIATAAIGVAAWYTNTRAYYAPIATPALDLQRPDGSFIALDLGATGTAPEAIDADSSPLRFRACAQLPAETAQAQAAQAMAYPDPTPLIAPAWFDCFDAQAIGEALEQGAARAYLSHRDIERGVDRVIAFFPDGRTFAWHQLNGTLQ